MTMTMANDSTGVASRMASRLGRHAPQSTRSTRGKSPAASKRQGLARWHSLLALAGALLCCPVAQAAGKRVEVAPFVLQLQEAGWVEREAVASTMQVNNGAALGIGRQAKLIYLPAGPGDVAAVMRVRASRGPGSVFVANDCEADEDSYVNDQTRGRKFAPECVQVYGPLSSRGVLAEYLADAREVLEREQLSIGASAWLVSIWFANDNGSTLHIDLLLDRELSLAELAGTPPEAKLPDNIPPQIAAWADALGRAARGSIRSFSGELAVPPLRAATAATAR